MDDIVRLQPNSSYATLAAAIALANGRRVALVFPTGKRTCLHDTALLDALYTRCQLLGKEAVIIGGDASLRAHAVAAGFEAATTLEDWGETTPEIQLTRSGGTENTMPQLWLVTPEEADVYDSDEEEAWVSEPPEYVAELRQALVGRSSAIRKPVLIHTPAPAILDEYDDDPITASERFEEMITGRILETSGLHRPEIPGIF